MNPDKEIAFRKSWYGRVDCDYCGEEIDNASTATKEMEVTGKKSFGSRLLHKDLCKEEFEKEHFLMDEETWRSHIKELERTILAYHKAHRSARLN